MVLQRAGGAVVRRKKATTSSSQLSGSPLGRQKVQLEGIGVKTIGCSVSFDMVLSLAAIVVACAAHIYHSHKPEKGKLAVQLGRSEKIAREPVG